MALVILSAPDNQDSVSSEMLFVIQEATKSVDPVTYPNYKYVLDVYVDSVLKARLRVPPDPTYSFGKFDVSAVLRDYVPAYGLKASSDTETYGIRVSYQVKLGEEYGDTLYTNLVTDSERTAYRSYANRPFLDSDIITARLGKAPSNMPESPVAMAAYKDAKWLLMPYIDNASGATVSAELSSNGTAVGGGTVDFVYTGAMLNKVMQCNIGFDSITTSLGLTEDEKASVDTMIVTNNASNVYKYSFTCSKHPIITLAWLNPYGAYESQSFGLVSKKTNTVSRKEYARLPYEINASGQVSYDSNGVMYGSKRGYASTTKNVLSVTSHLLTEAEYTWLADLFSSTDVYMYNSVIDRFVPVTISDSNYEYRTYLNSRLTPLQFTVQFSDEYNSQYL